MSLYQHLSLLSIRLKYFLFAFLFGVCCTLNAQTFKEGYIVTNENDTLKGLVKNKNLSPYRIFEKVKFKEFKEAEEKEFTPDQLNGFLINTEHYVSRNTGLIDGVVKKMFMKVMAQGYLSYYEFEHTGLGSRSTYLTVDNIEQYAILQKQNENIEFVTQINHMTFSFKKRMADYLKDDPEVYRKIKKGIYTRNDVLKIVNEYNGHKNKLQATGL